MYDEGNTGIMMRSGFVATHAGDLHVYADRTQAGNIVFITTDNFKKYIPIEWIRNYIIKVDDVWHYDETREVLEEMLKEWEKENENS